MGSLVGLYVLIVVLGFVKTELQNKEFALGGTLTLKPAALTSSISSITWKHNDNLLAEQLTSDSKPDYYPQNEVRISLNFKTGELSIIKLTEKDAGRYNVEINNVIQNVGYQVKIIKPVPVPTVVVQPLACSDTSTDCGLGCQGDVTGAGTVRYFWKEDDGDWEESAKKNKKDIKNDADTQTIKEFFCKVNNSVSDKESAATKNPFYKETPGLSAGVVVGSVFGLILVVVLVGVLLYVFKKRVFSECRQNSTDKTNGTGPGGEEDKRMLERNKLDSEGPKSPATGADGVSAPKPTTKSDPPPTTCPEASSKV